jgi:BASS family bile acid:Na+ symporter
MDLLRAIPDIATAVFTWSSMLAVGLAHTFQEVFGPLRRVRTVILALVANFVLAPLLAELLIRVFSLEAPHAIGLLLLSTAAGAPFVVQLVKVAEGDLARTAALLVLLMPVSVPTIALVLPMVLANPALSGFASTRVSVGAIAWPLVLNILLPLAIGLVVRRLAEPLATRVQPSMGKTASVAVVVLIASTVLVNLPAIVALFTHVAIVALLLFTAGAFVIGYLCGGRDRERRVVLGLGTGLRGAAAAMVVATQTIEDPGTLVMVLGGLTASPLLLLAVAWLLRRRRHEWPGQPEGRWGERSGAPAHP